MMHSTSANLDDLHHHQIMPQDFEQQNSIINKSTCPISWKLYQNPFFIPTNPVITNFSSNNNNNNINDIINSSINPLKLKPKQLQRKYSASAKFLHHSDLKMSSNSKTQIAQLKSELEMERTLRKRMQSLNKKLSKELIDQSQRNDNNQIMCCLNCDDLMKEVSRLKGEMEKMKEEMNEERKMLRMAEVLREERVQMKLADAQIFYQQQHQQQSSSASASVSDQKYLLKVCNNNFQPKKTVVSASSSLTPSSPEVVNPHIKQGIKGFVEFQRAIKAKNNGCNFNNNNYATNYCNKQLRDLGGYSNKVECQKAQLRVLFKHKCSVPYSTHNDHSMILS